MATLEQLKAARDYQTKYNAEYAKLAPLIRGDYIAARGFGDGDGNITGYGYFDYDGENNIPVRIDPKYLIRPEQIGQPWQLANMGLSEDGNMPYGFYRASDLVKAKLGDGPSQADYSKSLRDALLSGVDLSGLGYGSEWDASNKFLKDVGGRFSTKNDSFMPANPVGYSGGYKFDPNFGSGYYRELAMQAGQALGLTPEQILKVGSNYTAEQLYDPSGRKGALGFNDLGKGLIDRLAVTAGADPTKLGELSQGALKPLYDANANLYKGLNDAARIESNSSGFFKQIGQDIAKLGPIGTIALTAALGPAAGALAGSLGGGAALATGLAAGGASALPGLLQGDIGGALKSGLTGGLLAGVGAGALKGIGSGVSDAVGGGASGQILGGAAQGALTGGLNAALRGGDIGQGLLGGGIQGGVGGAVGAASNAFKDGGKTLGTGITDGAKGAGLQLDPNKFGPTFDLPDTTGYVNQVPGVGGLLDGMTFPGMGLKPGAQMGLQIPKSPTFDFGSGLGQGLTVGVPGGALSQGGVTPTGQINLGDPNSFINKPSQPGNPQAAAPNLGKLLGGLLAGGAAAGAVSGLLGQGNNQQPQEGTELPVQRFTSNPTYNPYAGDYARYGEQDIGNFQFYRPNMGLLG